MFKFIALTVAFAAATSVAGAQATTASAKSAVKTPVAKTSTTATVKHRRTVKKAESQATLQKEAKVSKETARETALKEVPNGTVKSSELERENGKLIYSFAISAPGKTGIEEVNVNAIDGSVVNREHESAATEKKEAAKESKTKK
ncbi:MAG: PepSY domain-containing protein [Gemmatimonadaceae bacterium]